MDTLHASSQGSESPNPQTAGARREWSSENDSKRDEKGTTRRDPDGAVSRTASVFAVQVVTDTAKCYPAVLLQTSMLKLMCLMQPGQPGMNGYLERPVLALQ